jgi:hypothetical protein
VGRNLTRWLIPLPAILFSFFPQAANAEPTPGLATTYYTIDEIPPAQSTTEYPVCGSETENNINRNYDGELFEDCTYDLFMVHMTGYIDIPEHQTIEFMLASDDGGTIKIGLDEWGNWNDQGCTWMMSGPLELDAGSQPLELFMYENGGGTCLMLAWKIDDGDWTIVPDEAFTTSAVSQTTSTTTSTTTSSTTTTTSTSTTTLPASTSSSTTTLPTSTTTTTEPIQTSTTTSVESTTTTTTTTTQPAPTTTQAPYTPPQTTTTTSTSQPQPEPTIPVTETTVAEPETTQPETSTTYPSETVPNTTVPLPSVPTPTLPAETTTPTSPQTQTSDTPQTPTTTAQIPSTTTLPQITQQLTTSQAAEIASNPEVLAAITETQAEQLFEQLQVDELTEEQLAEFTAAIQEAPTKVKKAFEKTINIFGSEFENYVPTGSNIPVKTRRTLVAAGALIAAIPSTRMRR